MNRENLPTLMLDVDSYEFETILIQNFSVSHINATSFGNAIAHKLIIENNEELAKIDQSLWELNTTVLVVRANKNLNGNELVENLGNSTKLQTIELTYINIKSINSKAFKGLSELKYIFLQNNKIEKIEPEAFIGLKHLEEIRLDHNNIQILNTDSLAFDSSSTVNIYLNYNSLSKLEMGSLNHSTGVGGISGMNLYLEDNEIKNILDVFKILLNNPKNTMFLNNNKIECSCNLKDLTMNIISRMQLINLRCINKDNKDIFRLNRNEFVCDPPSNTTPSAKTTFASTINDTTTFASTTNDTTTFASTINDTTTFASTINDTTTFASTINDTTTFASTINDTTTFASTINDTTTFASTINDTTTFASTTNDTTTFASTTNDTTTFASTINDTTTFASTINDTTTFASTTNDTTTSKKIQ